MIRDIEREKYRRDNQRSPKLVGFRGIRGSSFALRRAGTITREHAENARGGGEGGVIILAISHFRPGVTRFYTHLARVRNVNNV
jgi:hypothetical protein